MALDAAQNTFQFQLVSPEKILVSEPATMVVIPGEAGDFGVLAGHAPVLSSIRPGVVELHDAAGATRRIFVAGGFADVSADQCSVLAEEAIDVADLDRAVLEAELKSQNEYLQVEGTDETRKARILAGIDLIKQKIAALG